MPGSIETEAYIIYTNREPIGSGTFGVVYHALIKSSNRPVAAKKIKNLYDDQDIKKFEKELAHMKRIIHPNVIQVLGEVRIHKEIYIITQYCGGGCLKDKIAEKKIPHLTILEYIKQIVSAMVHMNDKNTFHRDLKPANILLDSNGIIKICDLGSAKQVSKINNIQLNTRNVGTPLYQAPNVSNGNYSAKCDVFSFGVIIYQMLTGSQVYAKTYQTKQIKYLSQDYERLRIDSYQKLSGDYHQFFKQLIKHTVTYEEEHRYSFQQLKLFIEKHQFNVKNDLSPKTEFMFNQIGHKSNNLLQDVNWDIPKQKNIRIVSEIKKDQSSKPDFQKKQSLVQQNINNNINNSNLPSKISQNKDLNLKDNRRIENWNLLVSFKYYFIWTYSRAQIFVNIASENLMAEENKKFQDKYKQFLFMLISIIIYKKTLDQLLETLNSDVVILPDGRKFVVSQLNYQSCKENYTKLKDSYQQQIICFKLTFSPQYLKQILYKLFEKKSSNKYNALNKDFRQKELKQIILFVNEKDQSKNVEYYEQAFRKVVQKQCNFSEQELRKQQKYLRLYWGFLKLANVNKEFKKQDYQKSFMINQFYEDYRKKSAQKILEDIQNLKLQISEKWR